LTPEKRIRLAIDNVRQIVAKVNSACLVLVMIANWIKVLVTAEDSKILMTVGAERDEEINAAKAEEKN
jgi:hypothetical protein